MLDRRIASSQALLIQDTGVFILANFVLRRRRAVHLGHMLLGFVFVEQWTGAIVTWWRAVPLAQAAV